jgi:hypothetical protein
MGWGSGLQLLSGLALEKPLSLAWVIAEAALGTAAIGSCLLGDPASGAAVEGFACPAAQQK